MQEGTSDNPLHVGVQRAIFTIEEPTLGLGQEVWCTATKGSGLCSRVMPCSVSASQSGLHETEMLNSVCPQLFTMHSSEVITFGLGQGVWCTATTIPQPQLKGPSRTCTSRPGRRKCMQRSGRSSAGARMRSISAMSCPPRTKISNDSFNRSRRRRILRLSHFV